MIISNNKCANISTECLVSEKGILYPLFLSLSNCLLNTALVLHSEIRATDYVMLS